MFCLKFNSSRRRFGLVQECNTVPDTLFNFEYGTRKTLSEMRLFTQALYQWCGKKRPIDAGYTLSTNLASNAFKFANTIRYHINHNKQVTLCLHDMIEPVNLVKHLNKMYIPRLVFRNFTFNSKSLLDSFVYSTGCIQEIYLENCTIDGVELSVETINKIFLLTDDTFEGDDSIRVKSKRKICHDEFKTALQTVREEEETTTSKRRRILVDDDEL